MQTVTFILSLSGPSEDTKARYAAGFFCVFLAGPTGLCGDAGVVSIRRSTSSSLGGSGMGFGLLTMELL